MITRAQGAKKNPGTNISQLTGVGSTKFIYVDLVLHVESIIFFRCDVMFYSCLTMVNMEFCSRVYFYVRVQYCLIGYNFPKNISINDT